MSPTLMPNHFSRYAGISYRILEEVREADAPPLTLGARLSGQP